jgi:hypothetical protein
MLLANTQTFPPAYYDLHPLPPLLKSGDGIFSKSAPQNNDDQFGYISSTHLYFAPSNNDAVNALMNSLSAAYPSVISFLHIMSLLS